MQIFISWAKDERSRVVASALRNWLPDVIQSLKPWASEIDIGAGVRWSVEVADALSKARIGILCVTPTNQHEPWLMFEAGALAKMMDTRVCPYLIGMQREELESGPLEQFQAKTATKEGTFDLISTINSALGAVALPEDRLNRLFAQFWPVLEQKFEDVTPTVTPPHKPSNALLVEILETVRALDRQKPAQLMAGVERRWRLEHSQEVANIVDVLANSGYLTASHSVRVRWQLASMPPRDLESVRRMVHQSMSSSGHLPHDAFENVMNFMRGRGSSDATEAPTDESRSSPAVKDRRIA